MKAIIDNSYARAWNDYYDANSNQENTNKMVVISTMAKIAALPHLQAGVCNWNSSNRISLKRWGLDDIPGVDNFGLSTWCPWFVFSAYDKLKKNIEPALGKQGRTNIGAQTMYANLLTAVMLKKACEVDWKEAQASAENLELPIVVALPVNPKGSGHVAILSPMIPPNPTREITYSDLWVCQAGAQNGFFPLIEIFNAKNGVKQPKFFIIKE